MKCTFIGHRMVPSEIQASLEAAVIGVIKKGVKSFYIGNHGDFDKMATKVLKKLSVSFPQIKYATVLAYMPTTQQENTVFPEGLGEGGSNLLPIRNAYHSARYKCTFP